MTYHGLCRGAAIALLVASVANGAGIERRHAATRRGLLAARSQERGSAEKAPGAAAAAKEPLRTSWAWSDRDTRDLLVCFGIGAACAIATKLLIGLAFVARGHFGTEKAEEAPSWPRFAVVVAIGFAPLLNCVLLGERFSSVLIAMVAMHWGAMLLVPALYTCVRTLRGHGTATMRFYRDLASASAQGAAGKLLRGSTLGVPCFLGAVCGLLLFRCKTASWGLCVKNFRGPLEDYGFYAHSFWFRLIAAVYFTLWNPLVEEFFWRVFLHRELGSAMHADEDVQPAKRDDDGPWMELVHGVYDALPRKQTTLRWGASCLYASYHTWPIKVVFQHVWPYYAPIGFCFLACLGRFILLLRESEHFGLPAAYALHAWVDAAFAVLCLFELHPVAVLAGGVG